MRLGERSQIDVARSFIKDENRLWRIILSTSSSTLARLMNASLFSLAFLHTIVVGLRIYVY